MARTSRKNSADLDALEEELPSSLKSLAYRNGIQIRPDPDFNGDIDRLIKGIELHLSHAAIVHDSTDFNCVEP